MQNDECRMTKCWKLDVSFLFFLRPFRWFLRLHLYLTSDITAAFFKILRMKLVFACWLFLLLLPMAQGQTVRLNWKPTDFQPLTSLPWKTNEHSTAFELHEVPKIVECIFREPNPDIRYPVLAEYLCKVPMLHFAAVFDVALVLEGTQTPNDLVALMLRIWAERDPQEAWERVQELVRLVGLEDGWLQYDSWNRRPKITVQDLAALRASRYWLGRNALLTFPLGVEASEAPQADKVRLLKAFADMWFEKFQSWPGARKNGYVSVSPGLMDMFGAAPYDHVRGVNESQPGTMSDAAFEVGLRRWISERPREGPEVIQRILHQHWVSDPYTHVFEHDAIISKDFLLTWSQAEFQSLIVWSNSAEQTSPEAGWIAKCLMMPHVDNARREKWLSGLTTKELGNRLHLLAPWNPELAMEWAVRAKDADMIEDVATSAVYGFGGRTWNRSHAGLGFINSFDLKKLPKDLRMRAWEWGIAVMEQWGCVDIGEAARYGFRFLMHQDWQEEWPDRADLLRFFSGVDEFPDEGGMIDRTFCALRVWAVVRPDEMRAWIGKQEGADVRKALTWLLEHPWGGDEEKKKPEE